MSTKRFEKSTCNNCGNTLDAASGVTTESLPEDGDVGVCFHCGSAIIFDAGKMRNMTGEEFVELDAGTRRDIFAIQQRIKEFWSGVGGGVIRDGVKE